MHQPFDHSTAQFAGLAVRWIGNDGLSVGVECFDTTDEAAHTAADNGAYVFTIGSCACRQVVRDDDLGTRELTTEEVLREREEARRHLYTRDGLPDDLRAMLAPDAAVGVA